MVFNFRDVTKVNIYRFYILPVRKEQRRLDFSGNLLLGYLRKRAKLKI